MFEFNVIEIFEQKIINILIILTIIHFATVMLYIFLKCFRPYLQSYAGIYKSKWTLDKSEMSSSDGNFQKNSWTQMNIFMEKEAKTALYDNSDSDSSNEEYFNLIDSLKTFVDISEKPSDLLSNDYSKSSEITNKNSLNHRTVLIGGFMKKQFSSEVQTNVTINPKVKIDYSYPKLITTPMHSQISICTSVSSDDFESASSGNSETDLMFEDVQNVCQLGPCDIGKQKNIKETITTKRVKIQTVECPKIVNTNNSFKKEVYSNNENYGKKVSKEKRILEMAISGFEKELKPIREQIKLLKDCLNGFDYCNGQYIHPNNFNSSTASTVEQSECLSEALSVTCSSNMHDSISSAYTILDRKSGLIKGEIQLDKKSTTKKDPSLITTNCDVKKHMISGQYSNKSHEELPFSDKLRKSSECNIFKKRSPLAEMYVKLSQCRSHASCVSRNRNHKATHNDDNKTVMCHINLSVNLGGVTFSNINNKKWLKERELQPLLSEPDDIFGKPSDTHVSLKPARHPTNKF